MHDLGGVGQVLAGRYRVEYVLGRGGMGVVVAALDLRRGERVALKFLLPETLSRADAVPRFLREARAAARLKSEHVARVTDVGTLDWGAPYIVMELLAGSDLHRIVKTEGPLPLPEAVEYVLQACDAIGEAHAFGIVHRDLKSENLFLTRRADGAPWVKVLDFGISKAPLGELLDGAITSMTRTDVVMGSPQYMSPEQLRSSKDVDARADVWSLGVVLYELTTASFPFEAETLVDLMTQIIGSAPVSPRSRRPDLPVALEQILLRCLEKDRSLRYANAAELSAALSTLQKELFASSTSLVKTLQTALWGTATPAQLEASPRTQTASAWHRNAPNKKAAPRLATLLAALAGLGALAVSVTLLVRSADRASDARDERNVPLSADAPGTSRTHATLPPSAAALPASAATVASTALRAPIAAVPAASGASEHPLEDVASRSAAARVPAPPSSASATAAATDTAVRAPPAPPAAAPPPPPPPPPQGSARPRRPAVDVFAKRKW